MITKDGSTPRIEVNAIARNYGRFLISPLERGFGITVGNALRRVLLSSLPGAAVTSIRIDGIHHEFSPIAGAKEDTTRLVLNVKQLRLKAYGDQPVKMRLSRRGPGVVTAADLEVPSDVELVNPDAYLMTLDSDDSEVEVEMTVQRGVGYSPAEERGKLPIGEIPVDAIFSPIRNVTYTVDMKVAREEVSDDLWIEIWTDGTIEPQDALRHASDVLVAQFSLVSRFGVDVPRDEPASEEIPPQVYDTPIDDLGLSMRAYNCLKRAGITRVGEVLERMRKGDDEMLAIRNFGQKSLDELKDKLRDKGYMRDDAALAEEEA